MTWEENDINKIRTWKDVGNIAVKKTIETRCCRNTLFAAVLASIRQSNVTEKFDAYS